MTSDIALGVWIATTLFLSVMLVGTLVACFLIWNLYVRMRNERDVIVGGRDGWRDVAQRALVVAQLHGAVTRRAVKLAVRTMTE